MTETAAPEASGKKTVTKLLKDLGPQLPVGVPSGSGLIKDMSHKEWKLKHEKELGELRDKHRDANVAQYVSMILGTMYNVLGDLDLASMSLSDKRGKIGRFYMADVFYSYMWLRLVALGNVLETHVTCPSCSFKFVKQGDLHTVEVECAEKFEDLLWTYQLQNPIEIQGQKVTHFEMAPAKWRSLEGADVTGGMNTGAIKAMIIRGSINKVPEMIKGALSDSDLDELSKRDIEGITRAIDDHAVGPDMSIEGKCPRCHNAFKASIDWGYDSFFGGSSR